MSRFVKVKNMDCRFTPDGGSDVWVNLDNIIVFDEQAKQLYLKGGITFPINEDDVPKLIEAMKGGAE